MAEGRLIAVDVVDVELEAKVAGVEALVRLEAVQEGGMLKGLDLAVNHVDSEL